MEEHIILGDGPPTQKPMSIGMHYIDVNSREKYTSTGKDSVQDWGSPLIDRDKLNLILAQFDPYADGPTRSFSKMVPVSTVGGRRQVRIFPSPDIDGGRYVVISDANNLNTAFNLDFMNVDTLRDDEEIIVFNGTIGPMLIAPTEQHEFVFALSPTARGRNRGEVRFKLVRNLTNQTKLWVVTGDLEINN